MYRMILVLPAFLVIGCGTPSDVHMSDKDIHSGRLVVNAYFYDTDPISVAYAAELTRYSYEMSRAMKAVREAPAEESAAAEERLTALLAAKPEVSPAVEVEGIITNMVPETRACQVYLLDRQGRLDPHAAPVRVVILDAAADTTSGSAKTTTLLEGNRYHFRFLNPATGAMVFEQSMARPVSRHRGWAACVKLAVTI